MRCTNMIRFTLRPHIANERLSSNQEEECVKKINDFSLKFIYADMITISSTELWHFIR